MFLNTIKNRYLSAFSLLSRIPVSIKYTFDPVGLDFYIPLIGVLAAFVYILPFILLQYAGVDTLITSLIALGLYYYCFNLFHFDGLLDTADAFLGSNTKEKTRLILKDSGTGVYAFFTGFLYLAVKILLLNKFGSMALPYVCLAMGFSISGRSAAAMIPSFFPVSDGSVLGRMTKSKRPGRAIAGSFTGLSFPVIGFFILDAIQPKSLISADPEFILFILFSSLFIPLLSIAVVVMGLGRMYTKRIGGYSGDCLGAGVELAELLHIVLFMLCFGYFYA